MKNAWKFLGGCGCLSMLAGLVLVGLSFLAAQTDNLATYRNSRDGRTGNLAENYVDFSFDYPKTWAIKTTDPDNINFVTAERSVNGQTWENLNVGYFRPAPTEGENRAIFTQVLQQIEGQFSQQFRDFTKVREGETKVGDYNGYETLYTGWVENEGKRIDVFTRAVFVPTPDGKKGVSFMMMGTTLCPDLKAPEDLGSKGELPMVLESFKF